jgi:hypothetical protein
LFKKAENFFKHAKRDPEGVIDFSPEINEIVLWESSIKYVELTGEQIPAMQAINIWFQVRHPDVFKYDEQKKNQLKEAAFWVKSMSKAQFYKEFISATLLRGLK